jgi:LacI family transcriptional regulator
LRNAGESGDQRRRRRRIGLFMGLADHYERGIARGVVRFARGRPDWELYGVGWMFQSLGALESWDGHGIVARIESRADADRLRARGLPVVDVAGAWKRPGFLTVCNDDAATGRLAAAAFTGFRAGHFAFLGVAQVGWSRARREGFRAGTRAASLAAFEESLPWWEGRGRSKRLEDWLRRLPRPCALFACNDTAGLKAAAACRRLGIDVPGEIAILGVDNEDILCELSDPPLSSIMLDCEGIGYQAAQLLAARLDGRPEAGRSESRAEGILVPPRELVERASTRVVATGDELVQQVVAGIRSTAGQHLVVADLLKGLPVSRRALEIRVRDALGHGIHQEIIRARVDRARQLLRDTTHTMDVVAAESGFSNTQRFHEAFRRRVGMTPAAYRRSLRGGG